MRKNCQSHQWLAIIFCKCFSHRRRTWRLQPRPQWLAITIIATVVWAPIITKHSSKKTMCTKEKGLFTCTPIKTWCFPKK